MIKGPYYYIGRARGKDVFLSEYSLDKVRLRKISIQSVLSTLSKPWKRLIDRKHKAILPGFKRLIYVSLKYRLIVVVEENNNIVIVTSWVTSKDIKKLVENRVKQGVWVEE